MSRIREQLSWQNKLSFSAAFNLKWLCTHAQAGRKRMSRGVERQGGDENTKSTDSLGNHKRSLFLQYAIWIASVLFLSLWGTTANAQPEWQINCGGMGEPVCTPDSGTYGVIYNMQKAPTGIASLQFYPPYYFTHVQCDLALAPDANGNCALPQPGSVGNTGKRSIIGTSLNTPWIDFAMKQQRFGIQSDQAMNWITIFGTHNSFSNYQDGAFDDAIFGFNFNVDQKWSMTDQLDAGARVIRLDPVGYDAHYEDQNRHGDNFQLRMCHQSGSSLLLTSAECDVTSYGRLFAYGVDEVHSWLENHPDEVLVLRMNRTQAQDLAAIDAALEVNMQDKGGYILTPAPPGTRSAGSWDPALQGWPTMRQMRAMGKRLIIFSDNGTPHYSFPWSYVVNDGYSDATSVNIWTGATTNKLDACENQDGLDVRTRAFNQWSYIGEDRTGSNAIDDGTYNVFQGGKGLLNEDQVATSADCGFGLINVDFLLAGKYAPTLANGFDMDLGAGGHYSIASFNYTFGEDRRREAAIWSWDEGEFGLLGPAFMKASGRWGSAAAGDALKFACAVNPGNQANPAEYAWVITQASGPWTGGPKACQAAGGTFWAPQSALENVNLLKAANGQQVWVNYIARNSPTLEPVSQQLSSTDSLPAGIAGAFVVTLTQGKPYAAESPVFQYTGGVGGPLRVVIDPSTAPLLAHFAGIDTFTKTIRINFSGAVYDSGGRVKLQAGTYEQAFKVGEGQGGGHVDQSYLLEIHVVPIPMANVTVGSTVPGEQISVDGISVTTPHTFSWEVGSQHSLTTLPKVTVPGIEWIFQHWSDGAANITDMYTVPGNDSNIVADFKEFYYVALSPAAHGVLSYTPAHSNGFYLAGSPVTVTATASAGYYFTGFTGQVTSPSNPVTFQVFLPLTVNANFAPDPKVVVESQVPGQSILVDGVAVVTPHSYNWAPGSTHTLDAGPVIKSPGHEAVFQYWSDGDVHPRRVYIVPQQGGQIQAQFNQYLQVSLTSTIYGTLAVSPTSPIGEGFYPVGSAVTFTATPAAGFNFAGFTGDSIGGTVNPHTVQISRPMTVGAAFAPLH